MQKFSVLMSVYINDKSTWFRSALDSVGAQTVLPAQLVIVIDGPISDSVEAVLEAFVRRQLLKVKVVRLEKNMGLGYALSIGLGHCEHNIVARMDSDDICLVDRFKNQIEVIENYDIVGTGIAEFLGSVDNIVSRRLPNNDQIKLKKNAWLICPFNHPTVMFKKDKVLEAGGYRTMHSFEDWYLWLRIFANTQCKVYNIQKPLLAFRVNESQYERRRGNTYKKREMQFLNTAKNEGLISYRQFVIRKIISGTFRLLPVYLFKSITKKLLRK